MSDILSDFPLLSARSWRVTFQQNQRMTPVKCIFGGVRKEGVVKVRSEAKSRFEAGIQLNCRQGQTSYQNKWTNRLGTVDP